MSLQADASTTEITTGAVLNREDCTGSQLGGNKDPNPV